MTSVARELERQDREHRYRELTERLELEPDERIALALERIADLGELVVDRLELVLELLPITGEELEQNGA